MDKTLNDCRFYRTKGKHRECKANLQYENSKDFYEKNYDGLFPDLDGHYTYDDYCHYKVIGCDNCVKLYIRDEEIIAELRKDPEKARQMDEEKKRKEEEDRLFWENNKWD